MIVLKEIPASFFGPYIQQLYENMVRAPPFHDIFVKCDVVLEAKSQNVLNSFLI